MAKTMNDVLSYIKSVRKKIILIPEIILVSATLFCDDIGL